MSFRDQYNKRKKDLNKRHEETANRQTGSRFTSIFVKENIPEDIEFFKCGEGQHVIDILPFILSDEYPNVNQARNMGPGPGDIVYMLDLYTHTNIGPNAATFVCPFDNWGEPCPICQYLLQCRKENKRLSKEEFNELRTKRRNIFLIWSHDTPKEEAKGPQIFEVAHYFMGEPIEEIAKKPSVGGKKDGGFILFEDINEGKSVCWTRKGAGKDNTKYIGHKLVDREQPIPDEILDKIFSLDKAVNLKPSYEEIEKAFTYEKEDGVQDERIERTGGEKEDDESSSMVDRETPSVERTEKSSVSLPECFGINNGREDGCPACLVFDECFDKYTKRQGLSTGDKLKRKDKSEEKTETKQEAPAPNPNRRGLTRRK